MFRPTRYTPYQVKYIFENIPLRLPFNELSKIKDSFIDNYIFSRDIYEYVIKKNEFIKFSFPITRVKQIL